MLIHMQAFQRSPLAKPMLSHASFWITALSVGLISVLYAQLINLSQKYYYSIIIASPFFMILLTPLLFLLSVFVVRKFAPEAKGSGIPQVLQAIELGDKEFSENLHLKKFVSIKTAVVKVISSSIAILGGASVGREGPTVQIAASLYSWTARKTNRWLPHLDFQSYLVAGGAAGVAAAFNTPLAGIAFAIEEIGETQFPKFKENVMLSVMIGGIAAQALAGNYLYFGHPQIEYTPNRIIFDAVSLGILGGVLGGLFSWLLSRPLLKFIPKDWIWRAIFCGIFCALINYYTKSDTAGSGYEVTKRMMEGGAESFSKFFFLEKFGTTILSYISGMAGGIFSPCLSIGAGLGAFFSFFAHIGSLKICALLGMVAFFSGVVQAPLTAVIIVMEMTDNHILIIPLMIAAYTSQIFAKKIMPVSLYKYLAFHYK
jgi:H+/Cl- antiporter ClcA